MKKYAVISDIHGNIAALKNVVSDAISFGCSSFVFLGDYIFDLP